MDKVSQDRIDRLLGVNVADPVEQYTKWLKNHALTHNRGLLFEMNDGTLKIIYPLSNGQMCGNVESSLRNGTFINTFEDATDYSYYHTWKDRAMYVTKPYFIAFPADQSIHGKIRQLGPL